MGSDVEHVVLSARWSIYIEQSRFDNSVGGVEYGSPVLLNRIKSPLSGDELKQSISNGYVKAAEEFIRSGKYVSIVLPVPEFGWHIPKMYARLLASESTRELSYPTDIYRIRNNIAISEFRKLKETYPEKVFLLDPAEMLCDQSLCRAIHNNVIQYLDDDHLSNAASYKLTQAIFDNFKFLYY